MNMMRKRLISLNLAILMLLSLVLPAGAAELGEPVVVLTAEQPEAQTGEPAVQAEGPDEGPIAIFYTEDHAEYARVDASADGWTPPALPSALGGGQNLYWYGEGEVFQQPQCIHGVRYPKLPATVEFHAVLADGTRGILFSDNGKLAWTDSNRFMMRSASENDTGLMKVDRILPSLNGQRFLGWTPTPEDSGSYLTMEDTVSGTDKGWVTLYAQWTPEGQTAVYFGDAFYGFTNVGTTYMLPAAGNDNTIVTGWQVFCETENSNDQLRMTRTTDGGWQVDVPANAMKLRLYPEYQYFGSAVIGGKTYRFTENETFFSGDGWQLQSLSGGVQLRLNGYHGGAIDLPYTDLVTVTVSLFGDNAITGGADAPALHSAGDLRFDSRCEANQHTSLTVTAGSGQSAVSAKRLDLAAHIVLTGGEGAPAVTPETEIMRPDRCRLYGDETELTGGHTIASCLKTEPYYVTLTVDGNGGITDDEKTTLVWKNMEVGVPPNIDGLFHRSGYMSLGFSCHYDYAENKPVSGTVTLNWAKTGYEHFVAFYVNDAISEELDHELGGGRGYLFRDNSQTVTAPAITYTNSSKVLAYWQNTSSESEAYRQYLPGEQVTEPDGTKFYAVTIRPDAQLLLVSNDLTSDGKTFDERGTRIRVSDGEYRLSAADGSQLLSWNTQADGKGTAYAPNTKIDLSGRTTPLVLYAQWQQAGKTAIYFDETFKEYAEPGTTYQFEAEAASEGCALLGWSGSWFQNGRHRGWQDAVQNEDGSWTIEIPADATELHLYKQEVMNQPFTIDGKSYQPGENKRFFSGDGWRLSCFLNGSVTLTLTNYDGGAINIPTAELAVWLWGKNYINGSTNGPALCGAGELYFVQNCDLDQNSHSELTITAGSGQNAISAKQIQLAAHITLNGGTDATAVSSEAKVLTAYNYSLCDGAGNELTGGYNNVPCLKAVPVYSTVTLNGNGGVAANNKTTLTKQYENGAAVPNLGKLFKKSGSQYLGADAKWAPGREHWGVIYGDGTLTARWISTGYDRFVSFYMDGSIKEKLNYDFGWGGYIFRDNSKTVIAPSITYQDPVSNGNLVYWYPESNISDPECGHQYLPGETVNEADGTVLRAATAYPNGEIVLMANGKTFAENGSRVLIRTSLPNVTAADGAELVHWNTKPDGSGTAYGAYADISLRGRTEPLVLYAQWLQKGEIKVTIDMGKGSCAKSAKPGTRYELPEIIPSTKDRAFDHWGAYYRTKDGEYPDLDVKQDANGNWYVDIPADAAGVTCSAYFLPIWTFDIGGVLCKFERPDQVFKSENGDWTLHYDWRNNGCVVLRLYGYHGGMINLQLAEAAIEVYEDSSITTTDDVPALQAYGTLWLVTECKEDKHPTLTVTGVERQSAIDAAEVTFNGPHIVVTTQGAKAVKGEVNWAGDLCALRGGTSADNARALKWKEAQAEDLTYLKTDPLFSDVTFRGNGGKATDGSEKETLVKTYENGIYAKNLDRLFKKDGALYAGYAVGGRRHEESTSIYIDGDGTVDILWAESGYSNFVGFHTEGAIKEKLDYDFGWGAGYLFRDNSKTVIAPTITYQDPVSNGNLVYWYVSDDGEGSANAKQYLPGDVVKEESGTELYPAVVYANWNAAFMSNGKAFENGKLAIIAKQCPAEMKATDGTELIGWNTEKDGSGQAYAPGSKPDLSERTEPLVLYAQWKPVYVAKVEEPKPNEPQTGGTLTIKPRLTPAPNPGTGTAPEPTEPEKPAPIKKTQKVLVGVYRWGMMIAVLQGETDEKGEEIYCTVPKGLDLTGCALKLFVLSEAYAPDRKVEFILMTGE